MEGSTCYCSNTPPLDSNKIDDAKCDKPCMGYPFEMCGGSSSRSIASVLLIGNSAVAAGNGVPNAANTNGKGGGATTTAPAGPETSKNSQNDINSNPGSTSNDGSGSETTSADGNGGKAFNTETGILTHPRPTATQHRERERNGRFLKKETGQLDASRDLDEDSSAGASGSSPGIIAAGIAAVFAFAALFAIAFVFSKRRRQRLSQVAWTENMLLPSSLIHASSNDDELEGHDYTRSSPIYHKRSIHKHRDSVPTSLPTSNVNLHFPPPPALHPRQSGPLHMSRPSYPPPPPMISIPANNGGGHYRQVRGNPYQPYPPPPIQQLSQQQYDPYEQTLNHKEPVIHGSTLPPEQHFHQTSPFSRGPQSLQHALYPESLEAQSIIHDTEEDCERMQYDERNLSHHPSIRSIRYDRQERGGSADSTATSSRIM
ncbi:hypothetical protein FBU30_006800 [Linnemannia zychae]|nr:hypothetical protein FBU30_006800 [Linnemannia zychae]